MGLTPAGVDALTKAGNTASGHRRNQRANAAHAGDSFIHVSKIDRIVPVNYRLPEFQMRDASAVTQRIARHIAPLVPDGAMLQIGIGGVLDPILQELGSRKDFGVHTE